MRMPNVQLLHGETVVVRTPSVEYDEHMEEVETWTEATVENVLVAPGSTSDVTDSTRPDGTRVAFTLGSRSRFPLPCEDAGWRCAEGRTASSATRSLMMPIIARRHGGTRRKWRP